MIGKRTAFAALTALAASVPARADVTISTAATQNMNCSGGVCAPTATDATLNVSDLENLLASGNVKITTTGAGVQAKSIDVAATLGWSESALTLDAYQSLYVSAPVIVKGRSGLFILTNDGGSGGELAFLGEGHVTFKHLASSLSINGTRYKLVNSIRMLAQHIAANPSGSYALADDYDASQDGKYSSSPIATLLSGTVEGLGSTITKLRIAIPVSAALVGLFSGIGQSGQLRDLSVNAHVVVRRHGKQNGQLLEEGILVGSNGGTIFRASARGEVIFPKNAMVGGLVGYNVGIIERSSAGVALGTPHVHGYNQIGGLVGLNGNEGQIEESYASGDVDSGAASIATSGGLVGSESGSPSSIVNCYATGSAKSAGDAGGLIGFNEHNVSSSYSTGTVSGGKVTGGLIGWDTSSKGSLNDTYWDTDSSGVTDPGQGAGSPYNDPGITGLSTEQLQSGLPQGFDPKIWAEDQNLNNGLPYLINNPPPK